MNKLISFVRIKFCLLIFIFFLVPSIASGKSYKAGEAALKILSEPHNEYSVEKNRYGDYVFTPDNQKVAAGFLFYPGGKVKYESYLPLADEIAKKGYLFILIDMPGDLALFNRNAAKKYISLYPEISHWFIGGHSLGGAMAGTFISGNSDSFEGLILLAAYSTSKIPDKISVLSVYGSCDQVLNMDSYRKNRSNLPENLTELIIEGGCHSFFGDYGHQKGDGNPLISREEQLYITADAIDTFIHNRIVNSAAE